MSTGRKIMCMAKEDKLEEALYLWFLQKRNQGNVSGRLLPEKVVELPRDL